MAKYLLLWSLTLVLAGSAASAEPLAAPSPRVGIMQVESAPAPLCKAQELDTLFALKPSPKLVPICQGNGCSTTSDCRPASLPECASCFCLGPAGDKSCGCF